MLEISLPDWFFWLNFKEKWLTTRWTAYNKNNNEKGCHAEHLKFSEQWMQTGAQSGCHNYTLVLKHPVWRGSCGIISFSKSCYFSDVKTPLISFHSYFLSFFSCPSLTSTWPRNLSSLELFTCSLSVWNYFHFNVPLGLAKSYLCSSLRLDA